MLPEEERRYASYLLQLRDDLDRTEVRLHLTKQLPYRISESLDPLELTITVYGVTSDIDWIVFGSVTPSYNYSPPDAPLLQHELGIPVFDGARPRDVKGADISLACSTWVSALMITYSLIRSGMAKNILLIGADRMSAAINWHERGFATVLGDAGTAALCTAVPEEEDWFAPDQFWGWMNGEGADMIVTPIGGSRYPLRDAEDVANLILYPVGNQTATAKKVASQIIT